MLYVPSYAALVLSTINECVSFQGNAIVLNADTSDSFLQVLHMTKRQFLAVASASLGTYTLFQIPSNYMLKYFAPPYWLAFLMLGWGATLMIMAVSRFTSPTGCVRSRYIFNLACSTLLNLTLSLVPGMIYFFTLYSHLSRFGRSC